MKISLTRIELDLVEEAFSAGMSAIIAERNKLQELGLHKCADELTERYGGMNYLREKIARQREEAGI